MKYSGMIPCRHCGALCQETDECLCATCEPIERDEREEELQQQREQENWPYG